MLIFLALLRQGPFTGRGKDIFRSRKSTTSRAPSMHVDDFMKFGQPVQYLHRGGLAVCNWYKHTYDLVLFYTCTLRLPRHFNFYQMVRVSCVTTLSSE